jgi:hypothetical protein
VAEFPFTLDTKSELLLAAVVERLDAVVEALAAAAPQSQIESITAPLVATPTPSPRKRAPKRSAEEA